MCYSSDDKTMKKNNLLFEVKLKRMIKKCKNFFRFSTDPEFIATLSTH